jgi:hypothetical protein
MGVAQRQVLQLYFPREQHNDIDAVNTRCIYHRLKASQSDPDNLTLCPILDFANHTSVKPCMLPSSQAEIWDASPVSKLGDNFTLMSPANVTIEAGTELYLTYGAHCNRTLFVEYGFVSQEDQETGEVDIQDLMEPLFKDKPQFMCRLQEEGYWGYAFFFTFGFTIPHIEL